MTRDDATLNDDQLLQALAVGNVVIVYGTRAAAAGADAVRAARSRRRSRRRSRPPATRVILARRPGTTGLVALAWTHLLRVQDGVRPGARASSWRSGSDAAPPAQ